MLKTTIKRLYSPTDFKSLLLVILLMMVAGHEDKLFPPQSGCLDAIAPVNGQHLTRLAGLRAQLDLIRFSFASTIVT